MADKKADVKFTIQFNRANPEHLRAAEILNSLGRRGKAQYIAIAVLHYESCDKAAVSNRMFDEKSIEAVVHRILRECNLNDSAELPDADDSARQPQAQTIDETALECADESLSEDGRSAVAEVLEMFRKKG